MQKESSNRGEGAQPIRRRSSSNTHIEVIKQMEVLPVGPGNVINLHPVDNLEVSEATRIAAPNRAVWNTPVSGRSPICFGAIAVLFARRDSVYKSIEGLDVYDEDRDARTYDGVGPVIAHPPCRGWGRLRTFSNHTQDELDLARQAVRIVRLNGGVLEHPYGSALWEDMRLPAPGVRDGYGGWTLPIFQFWFGHKAQKATLLYIVGIEPQDVPDMPFSIAEPEFQIGTKSSDRPEISKADRERTPEAFAFWLVDLASRVTS